MPWVFNDSKGNIKTASVGLTNPQAKITGRVSQSIANSTPVQLNLGTIEIDTDNMASAANSLTVKTAGRYLILGKVYYNGAAGGTRDVWIEINGSPTTAFNEGYARDTGTVANGSFPVAHFTRYLNAGDVITLWTQQSQGAALGTMPGNISAELEAIRQDQTLPASKPTVGAGMSLICAQVLSASQGTFDTNTILGGNIPQTYNHLKAILVGRSTLASNNDAMFLRFNNDSGANYDQEGFYGQGGSYSGTTLAVGATQTFVGYPPGTSVQANAAAVYELLIPLYTGTTFFKNVNYSGGWNGSTSASSIAAAGTGGWRNTGAINRIQIAMGAFPANLFVAGSAFYLYGII